jgi:hypothetical protein
MVTGMGAENMSELFPLDEWEKQKAFYNTRIEYLKLLDYQKESRRFHGIDNIFFGDSLTYWWPFQELFPRVPILNRGITGDTTLGLHYRMEEDVLEYEPKRVFVLIGINDIEEDGNLVFERIKSVLAYINKSVCKVFASSILPLRDPDSMNSTEGDWAKMGLYRSMPGWEQITETMKATCRRRLRCVDKILRINRRLLDWTRGEGIGFVDYYPVLTDESGQLAEPCAMPDGNHITFEAYKRMSEVVAPLLAR